MNLIPIRFKFSVQFILAIFFVTILSGRYKLQINAQLQCDPYIDFFKIINKYNPEFDLPAYTTQIVRVDKTELLNMVYFKISDKDTDTTGSNFNPSLYTFATNDSNFFVQLDQSKNQYSFNLRGILQYNINNGHRYVVEVSVFDKGVPIRSSKTLVYVPLLNYNVNAPQYTIPVTIAAAITLPPGSQLGILNAWDIDGDTVFYQLDPKNSADIANTIDVQSNGVIRLRGSLTVFEKSFDFKVLLTDDGSSCDASDSPRIVKQSDMIVTFILIEVNMHSPVFVNNSKGYNYCEVKYQAYENTFFQIEIVAEDDDQRGQNGEITLYAPEISDRSPQNSFSLNKSFPQVQRKRTAIVNNLELFDYENPKYGSNTMNIMFIAEDHGSTRRRGYCFLTIEILDVNDNVPIFAQRSYTIYIHDQYKTRQFNYRFVAIDSDSGLNGQVQYFMVKDNPTANNLFNLALDGTLTIRNTTYLDIIQETLTFSIYAQDMSPTQNRSETVSVRVIKTMLKILPPFFYDFPDPAEIRGVSEMTPRGSILRNFSVIIQTNPVDQFLRCFLSPKPNPEWFKFEFPTLNRNLTKQETCIFKIEDPLNYRLACSMIVYMVAEVGNYLMPSTARELKILTVHLKEENINPPKFVTSTIEASVVEGDEDLNKVIAVVKAYDLDKTFPYNLITYDFDSNSNIDKYFSINSTTGEIKLMKRIHNKKNIPLEVVARDGSNGYMMSYPNQNSIYVDVKVIDINDNPPIFSAGAYEFSVNEDAQPGFVIGRLHVSDEDTETFFNFSISDSTFGIRAVYDMTKIKSASNYRGSAEIYLNNYLNYNKTAVYTLQVFVSDSQYLTNATVIIKVINANDHPPVFTNTPYSVYIDETSIPSRLIATLTATDDDNLSSNFLYQCYSTPYLDKSWFNLNPQNGQLHLLRGLNRDLSEMPIYYLPVSVTDQGGSNNNSLTTYTSVKIILNDINDNPPYLAYGANSPLIINEADNSGVVEIYVIDVDTPKYGPPFTFSLDGYQDLFGVQQINCPNCIDRAKYQLFNKKPLNRDIQKSYIIPYSVADGGGVAKTGRLEVIVGDIDNNPQSDGSKKVELIMFENDLQPNSFLGTLYVKDKDDWDLSLKTASNCIQNTNLFQIGPALQIYGPIVNSNFPQSVMNIQCTVIDPQFPNAIAKVDFQVNNVYYKDLIDLAGIRLYGITAENFILKKDYTVDQSVLDKFQLTLITVLGLSSTDVLSIVTIKNYVADQSKLLNDQIPNYEAQLFGTDIYFYARKNDVLISSRQIYSLLFNSLQQFQSKSYDRILLLFDTCANLQNDCPINTYCNQMFIISKETITVDGNATAIVGMNNFLSAECYCEPPNKQPTCYNGGTRINSVGGSDFYCQCSAGYEGPRCEMLSLTFSFSQSSSSHSYALFKSFALCDPIRIEFEFSTDRTKGLLLFNGPSNRDSIYFIAVEIVNKTLLVHIGNSSVIFANVNLSDKAWHKVEIEMSLNAVQVNLNECNSQNLILQNYQQMLADRQASDTITLSLGGIPPAISTNHYYYNVLNVFEYEGCIRNLRVNGDLRDLKLTPNQFNLVDNTADCDCKYQINCNPNPSPYHPPITPFPWWIILIIIAVLFMLTIILGLALCTIRRKDNLKKMLQMFPDDDIRETIINYADGAGEENTENFNIGVIKKPVGSTQVIKSTVVSSSIDVASNDQNMIYAYEGEGSDAGSLSSINSLNNEEEFNMHQLQEWGPKFSKLAKLYNTPSVNFASNPSSNGVLEGDNNYLNFGFDKQC